MTKASIPPKGANAALVLADGTVHWGHGIGVAGVAVGEVCFNTAITGYQEILTDPSYAGQIITFTFPHIGNVGANAEDMEMETARGAARGLVLRAAITEPSNWRAAKHLDGWLRARNLVGISGIDTRSLTRHVRDNGAPAGAIGFFPYSKVNVEGLHATATAWPGLAGMDLAREVTCHQAHDWCQTRWAIDQGYGQTNGTGHHVVAMDFGAKHNILRCLASLGCRITVVPATATAEEIMALAPDGIFFSNGPGDPEATGQYAVPVIQELLATGLPLFGICLGHQLLARALGAATEKMHLGHRGANHPVKDLLTGRVEITSQNHGFVVSRDGLPKGVHETHRSLFDGTLEGLRVQDRPVFSVQYHPEASPGPQDSYYLFERFVGMMGSG